jgi:hypothetical protein
MAQQSPKAWGNAPGFVKPKTSALKARFTSSAILFHHHCCASTVFICASAVSRIEIGTRLESRFQYQVMGDRIPGAMPQARFEERLRRCPSHKTIVSPRAGPTLSIDNFAPVNSEMHLTYFLAAEGSCENFRAA